MQLKQYFTNSYNLKMEQKFMLEAWNIKSNKIVLYV